MRIHYECFMCIANQCQRIIEMTTDDLEKRKTAAVFSAKLMGKLKEDSISGIVASEIISELYKFLGIEDPFKEYKERSNEIAKKILEDLYVDNSEELFKILKHARVLLYLTDNCGEIYFDKLFLKKIKESFPDLEIYIAGKEQPLINDATVNELRAAGLQEVGEIISTGFGVVGVPLDRISGRFKEIFDSADVIIAKGQANFETLNESNDRRIFYLLKAKCMPIARELRVPQGAMLCI
ncbi:hypothetical protein B6U96_16760 [Archaeoglobales archaeon ex4484_92]|nr:MAG: hypothetical protein B6U96_16760 [Archaeoglobales archaeon ex4484_92]